MLPSFFHLIDWVRLKLFPSKVLQQDTDPKNTSTLVVGYINGALFLLNRLISLPLNIYRLCLKSGSMSGKQLT